MSPEATEPESLLKPVIPTASKSKISTLVSYPVGAERISEALASTPQFTNLRLHFYADTRHMTDRPSKVFEYLEYLRVEYLQKAERHYRYPILDLRGRPPQYRWEIVVQPVPRYLRHAIKLYIVNTALPQMDLWLKDRSCQDCRGSEVLAFFYETEKDESMFLQSSRLEPLKA